MNKEQNFMMIFSFTPNLEYQPTEEELNHMKKSWGDFIGNIAAQGKLISTHQLGFEGVQINSNRTLKERLLITEGKTLGGNMIVNANSLHEAVELAKECPILNMGGSVEVRNILPM